MGTLEQPTIPKMPPVEITEWVVRFKDGYELPVRCKKVVVTKNGFGQLISLDFEGQVNNIPVYFNLDDIHLIYVRYVKEGMV